LRLSLRFTINAVIETLEDTDTSWDLDESLAAGRGEVDRRGILRGFSLWV
jgi:hypothetical protein